MKSGTCNRNSVWSERALGGDRTQNRSKAKNLHIPCNNCTILSFEPHDRIELYHIVYVARRDPSIIFNCVHSRLTIISAPGIMWDHELVEPLNALLAKMGE